MWRSLQSWVARLISSDSTASFGRFMSFVMTMFCLGWDTSYVYYNHKPLSATELVLQVGFCTAFYGATKTAEVYTAAKNAQAQLLAGTSAKENTSGEQGNSAGNEH